jgi:hypothetical protein
MATRSPAYKGHFSRSLIYLKDAFSDLKSGEKPKEMSVFSYPKDGIKQPVSVSQQLCS